MNTYLDGDALYNDRQQSANFYRPFIEDILLQSHTLHTASKIHFSMITTTCNSIQFMTRAALFHQYCHYVYYTTGG